ncbi:hypothetical protein OG711_07800 [Streptomyces uncialis]|uniref:hypothetical protein n=1 Tax=Streptomyces uncialis TaxID=1048205 RepID=UPI002E338426|nr:hypothetical protein [Streptomyces uncialis]
MTLTADQADRAVAVLGHPGVIRLIAEIDDHGPVARHMLSRTLPDLPLQQVRDGSVLVREHRLVRAGQRAGQPAYQLTGSGTALADVYDTAARWARAHHYPTQRADFTTRVRATLSLLAQGAVPAEATEPARALHQWIRANRTLRAAASPPQSHATAPISSSRNACD